MLDLRELGQALVPTLPGFQADRRREAIRRALVADLMRIKAVSLLTVAAASLVFALTRSGVAFVAAGLLGVAGLHVLGFVWGARYLTPRARQVTPPRARPVFRTQPRAGRPLYDPGLV